MREEGGGLRVEGWLLHFHRIPFLDIHSIANHAYIHRFTSHISSVPNALAVGYDALPQGISLVVSVHSYRRYFT